MIRRPDLVKRSRIDIEPTTPLMRLYEAMWEQARALGVLPLADPWDGIDDDIRLARILSQCSPRS